MGIEDKLIEMASAQGIWALLFVSLFIYQLRDSRQRESKYAEREVKYQELADKLSNIINEEIKHLRDTVTQFICSVGKKVD